MNRPIFAAVQTAARRLRVSVYLVGGPVRDELLSRPCEDWDLVSRYAKKMAQAAARALSAKFITLDEENRIYRVILPEACRPIRTLDFAELQGRTIEEDLARRDFSINAMAKIFPDGEIIDPLGGRKDLKKKIIRAVSEKAFIEDPLRLLRAFRFAAQFQFKIEPRTMRWIKKHRSRLSKTAAERIREELLRFWKQPLTGSVLRLMDHSRLLTEIFPEIEACRRTAVRYYGRDGVLKHSFETVENLEWLLERTDPTLSRYIEGLIGGYPRAAWLKWAAFLHDVGKPATAKMIKGRLRFFEHEHVGAAAAAKIGERLRLSRQEVQLLALWVRNHMRLGNLAAAPRITDKALSRFFRDLGEDGVGMILVSLADHYTYLARKQWGKGTDSVDKMGGRLVTSYFEEREKILPERLVNGHELMRKLKLKPGPVIGRLLEEIQDAQAEGKVRTKEDAFLLAKRKVKAQASPRRGPN